MSCWRVSTGKQQVTWEELLEQTKQSNILKKNNKKQTKQTNKTNPKPKKIKSKFTVR